MRNSFYFALAAFVLLAGAIAASHLWDTPQVDEPIYLFSAITAFGGVQENNEHPPLVKILYSSMNFIAGVNPQVLLSNLAQGGFAPPSVYTSDTVKQFLPLFRVMPLVLYLIAGLVVFFVVRSFAGDAAALLATALALFSNMFNEYASVIMLDMPLALFFTAAVFFYSFFYVKKRTWNYAVIVGLLVFMCEGMKFYGFVAALAILFAEFLRFLKSREIDYRLIVCILIASAWFYLFVYRLDMVFFGLKHYNLAGGSAVNFNFGTLFDFLSRLDVIIAVGVVCFAVWGNQRRIEDCAPLIGCVAGSIVALLFLNYMHTYRYGLYLIPSLAVFAALGLLGVMDELEVGIYRARLNEKGVTFFACFFSVFAGLLLLVFPMPPEHYDRYAAFPAIAQLPLGAQGLTNDGAVMPFAMGRGIYYWAKDADTVNNTAFGVECANWTQADYGKLIGNNTLFIYTDKWDWGAPKVCLQQLKTYLISNYRVVYSDDMFTIYKRGGGYVA